MISFSRPTTCICLLLLSVSIPSTSFAGQSSDSKSGIAIWEPDLVPSGAIAGECYARVRIPAQYSKAAQSVKVEEGYSRLAVTQPILDSHQEQVLTKEASVRYEVRQPVYKTVSEQFMVRPAYNKLSVIKPEFSRMTHTIQTTAPRLVWKRGNPTKLRAQGYTVHSTADDRVLRRRTRSTSGSTSAISQFNNQFPATHCGPTCEIWCLVEEPGESVSYNRKVMTSLGKIKHIPVPAKYKTIRKQVVVEPGSVREIPVPAEYESVRVEKVVDQGGQHMVDVPAKYGSVDKRTLIKPERYEWRRAVCAPGTLRRAQANSTRARSSRANTSSYNSTQYGSSQHRSSQHRSSTTKSSQQTGTTKTGRTYYYGTNKPVE